MVSLEQEQAGDNLPPVNELTFRALCNFYDHRHGGFLARWIGCTERQLTFWFTCFLASETEGAVNLHFGSPILTSLLVNEIYGDVN